MKVPTAKPPTAEQRKRRREMDARNRAIQAVKLKAIDGVTFGKGLPKAQKKK